jgi:LytS/YehU family sensor histidine kinase
MICGVAVSIKLLKKWYLENDRNQKIEKEKMLMELEMLKAQVHPHFLFNTLNNLYSLTLTKSDNAPVVVTNLSDLLRYMLYECREKEVPLLNEITALKKYVELEKLRYGNRLDISFSYSGGVNDLLIAPLLLLPFVENSFKHGMSEQLDQCWINLHLHAEHDSFSFNLSNSCSKEKKQAMVGGIGLKNIKKRLDLIYAEHYNLNINQDEDMYSVKLTMRLSKAAKPVIADQIIFSNTIPATAI